MCWQDFGYNSAAEEAASSERLWNKEINYDYTRHGGAPAVSKVSLPPKELCADLLGKRTQSEEAHSLLLTLHHRGKTEEHFEPYVAM